MSISSQSLNCFFLLPARGGSKGIPRKNLKPLAGKPLILHTLEKLLDKFGKANVIVSTDCSEIAELAANFATVHQRSVLTSDDRATLDDVALEVAAWLLNNGASKDDCLFTIQPTSPFLTIESISRAQLLLNESSSVLSVIDDRHLRWTFDSDGSPTPLYDERVNRQWLPKCYSETGGIIACRIGNLLATGTRIQEPIALLQLDPSEGLDIDDHADWAVAEYIARRRRIFIRADAAKELGMGHVYRAIALANEFAAHDVVLITKSVGNHVLGANFLSSKPFALQTIVDEDEFVDLIISENPDLLILDILDTDLAYVKRIRSSCKAMVNLEDLGSGNRLADLVINDLYSDLYPTDNHLYGVEHAILSPHFETVKPRDKDRGSVSNIMISFGGSDPMNLTQKALAATQSINYSGEVTVVLGPGYTYETVKLDDFGLQGKVLQSVDNMAQLMREADVALTSGGRTVTEFLCMQTPTIVICQNLRELQHSHASSPFGVINLGLGEHVSNEALAQHLQLLVDDKTLRVEMRRRASQATSGRSNARIASRILSTLDSH